VGNLTVGGTGKTPLVRTLARWLIRRGYRPAVLSRGYGGRGGNGRNDEAEELDRLLPEVLHRQGADRYRLAIEALGRTPPPDCLVLDDALQHRSLHQDLQIACIDATAPFGYGHLLPRGLLREPLDRMKRVSCVCLTRVDCVGEDELRVLRDRLAARTDAPLVESRHLPVRLHPLWNAPALPWQEAPRRRWHLACGIGNPEGFLRSVKGHGVTVSGESRFPDHHRYVQADLDAVRDRAQAAGSDAVLVTLKDAVKLERLEAPGGVPWYALEAELTVTKGMELLEGLLYATLGEQEKTRPPAELG
jgi:tetraacyldisaccharide 4'-kinase